MIATAQSTIKINEIFYSIQGEAIYSGLPTVFIRTSGCPLRCNYCDTEYAFYEGNKLSIATILDKVATYQCPNICLTGGEPLAQRHVTHLLNALQTNHYKVSIETSGAFDIAPYTALASIILDLKTPSSTEQVKNLYDNIDHIRKQDAIKFVIGDRNDFEWVCRTIEKYQLLTKTEYIYVSPSYQVVSAKELATWLLESQVQCRLQLQMHKQIWGDVAGK